ncbi:holo-ACP synthase [Streptomyces sp. MNU76]|uniref:holo-ACP synthase n=1 Tax=Streptomyces sp. MNU76 TaxID=2560026 RepID=UPI001E3F83A1|nr:holo-ACP synthase [Streptomyces sp. MNU76]MCC9703930.1 holo-ACP synthase [Streptomyces sp. MNU76]
MSLRIGVDVLDREELRALLGRPWFLRFAYAPEETALADAMGAERRLEFLAGRFAAKEAVLKVLGTGMLQGVAPYEICVDRDTDGAPVVRFRGRAARRPPEISLSITHKQNIVAAVAIALPGAACGCDDSLTESAIDRKEFAIMSSAADSDEDHHHSTERHSEQHTTAFLRVRIGQEEAHYGGGLVDGARILRLFGDLVTEITVRTDSDEGLLSEYSDVRFTAPVHPGDYIEASGRLVRSTRLRRIVELRAHKVIAAKPGAGAGPGGGAGDSSAEVLDEPQLVCAATATTVVPMRRAARRRERGVVVAASAPGTETGPATAATADTSAAGSTTTATAATTTREQ